MQLAARLNTIISKLLETDEGIEQREFDLWRGMAAGFQAQGGWGNVKGNRIEVVLRGMIRKQVADKGLLSDEIVVEDLENLIVMELKDGRVLKFSSEPDVALYKNDVISGAVEIKGGIDPAGVLERVGAAIKSLGRTKEENPDSLTVLLLQVVSMTTTSLADLKINQRSVNHWFTVVLSDQFILYSTGTNVHLIT